MNETDAYIAAFPEETQEILNHIRSLIIEVAPKATEKISYGMPVYVLNGKPLVYFAAFKNHIGFYATPTGHVEFKEKLYSYKQGKGSVQFPLNKAVPYDLIKEIVAFQVEENKRKG
jgi:uncharacterized protein YdhG (YjbR/CyaY superfamily)